MMIADDQQACGAGPAWPLGDRVRRRLLARALRSSPGAAESALGTNAAERAHSRRSDLHATLQAAIREDTAASLGRAGRRLQIAVDALIAHDALDPSRLTGARRDSLLREATHALYACVVQREALGLLDHRMLELTYRIPDELWLRMGLE